ncbi:cryptochrome/photolyase family protein [Gordonia sihwensis]|uniref:cryptochrome/photolyase family protein n=1 Tax=Gordonia TaxID=2053 RepID=UPI0024165DD9|nr:deoxyribodipyrimidine photo-lyase [Gordonia sihwensis]WFN93419.1 deoxyribodipyrimidine photo-lyase [Gordonia sihwensis]
MNAPAIVWFRRDLRLTDLPTLLAAADRANAALAVFVIDDRLRRPSGAPRLAFLADCLRALDADLGGRLLLTHGEPAAVIADLAARIGAASVHISEDFGPYGRMRDDAVEAALGAVPLVRTGSPYAVSPGRLRTKAGGPYRVFTPYRRAWLDHGWHSPARTDAGTLDWIDPDGLGERLDFDALAERTSVDLPPAGEAAALRRWRRFQQDAERGLDRYSDDRDRPDLDATTRLSPYLKFGCVHPRTLLHDLRGRGDAGAVALRSELAWRDFYADVLHRRPDTARANYHAAFDALEYHSGPDADAAFDAWCAGRTGYPIVDAGMRQLLAEGWMHNRVRMIVASFLTKDLHLPWWRGARHFMKHLVDGDLASNQHGWQWTAGCGTDAAPFFRIFNPVSQGERFDPDGDYVRRWVPELRGIAGRAVHRPWLLAGDGDAVLPLSPSPASYPPPMVDHRAEREVALARYHRL